MLNITLHFHYKYMQSPQTYVIGSKYHVLYKHACAGDSSTESEALVAYCKGAPIVEATYSALILAYKHTCTYAGEGKCH